MNPQSTPQSRAAEVCERLKKIPRGGCGGRQVSDTKITQYGFTMGPCEVTRIAADPKWGSYVEVAGKRQRIEIRVTPSGLLRVGKIINRKEHP